MPITKPPAVGIVRGVRSSTGGGGGASPFVSDTFTDTGGTTLQAHSPEVGGPWVRHPTAANNMVITGSGVRVRPNVANVIHLYYATGVPPSAEYDVQCDFIVLGAPNTEDSGIAGRIDTAAATMYICLYDLANTRWQLGKSVAGSFTDLGTFVQAITLGQTYVVKLQIRDAAKKVFVDGVERISNVDNAVSAAGKAGFRTFSVSAATDILGTQFDNFSAT